MTENTRRDDNIKFVDLLNLFNSTNLTFENHIARNVATITKNIHIFYVIKQTKMVECKNPTKK